MKLISQSILFSKSKLDRSILFNYFRAYIVLLLILCLATGFIYGIMNRSLKEQIVKVNNILIQNIVNFLEKEFVGLDELVNLINTNSRVAKYMNMQYDHLSPLVNYNAYEVVQDLAAYANGNDFVENIYIFFDNKSVISSTYKAKNSFYFEYLDKNQFSKLGLANTYNYKKMFYASDGEGNISIYYINSLPIGNKNTQKATVIIQINVGLIKSFIRDNRFTEKTETIIINSEQVPVIKYNTSNDELKEKDLVTTAIRSESLQWEIVSIIPRTEFEAKLTSIRSIIIYVLLFALLIGIVCAIYFSYKNYRPIVRLIEILNNEEINDINDNIFINIENSISKTISENRNLKEKIDKQSELVTNSVIEKLVKQEMSDEDEINGIMKISNIEFESSKFMVYSIKLDTSDSNMIDYSMIMSKLKELIDSEQKGYVFYINESNISILIEVINESSFRPVEFGKKCIKILNIHNISSTVGIGSYCHTVKEINRSYKEALLALNILPRDKGEVILYDSIKNLNNAKTKYYYPIDIEQEIINSVKAGNIEKVETLLEDVYNENFKEIQLSGQISQILIYNIISTVIKILDELKIDLSKFEDANILHQLYNAETVNDAYSSLISAYTVICDLVNQNKKSNNRYLFEKIENYLKEEYSNNDISIEFIAEKFNLSTSYLSRFFKEQAGINFYDYLQKIRIEKAKEIFIQSDNILVQEVALKVGYNNPGALIRAFNKYEGITPGEYRNQYL
jgi:two-component system response regulator YesN